MLEPTLEELGQVELFVHDSMHTTRNVSFELDAVWPRLRPGCVAVIDDVHRNDALSYLPPGTELVVARHRDDEDLFAAIRKRGARSGTRGSETNSREPSLSPLA